MNRCDRRQLYAFTVHRDLELLLLVRTAGKGRLNQVLSVQRKMAADRQPSARAEREPIHARVLWLFVGYAVNIDHLRSAGVAYRQAADFLRRAQIAFHRRG